MKASVLLLFLAASLHAETVISWQRQQLHGDFYSEGAGIGDINGDGKPDIVAGPFWWEGPAFEKKHAYYEPKIFSINGYSDNFFAYVQDFNADQKNDILILGFPGKEARLYLNPGTHDDKPWPMHIVADVVDNESPVFTDITGDGKPEIVCSTGGKFGWFAPNWDKPTEKWPFVAISEDMKVAKFTHGLGVGDVNGDGQLDLLEARRWWEQPQSGKDGRSKTADGPGKSTPSAISQLQSPAVPPPWQQHNFAAGVGGGAQMFAYDFDGNGTNDVFTALAAHRYGVAVYLQNKPPSIELNGTTTYSGNITVDHSTLKVAAQPNWQRIMLASEQPQDNDYGIVFSQPHAAYLADINGDAIKDIVTGKRYWAHNGHDPDEHGHRVIYWYETKRDGKGGVDFVPHLVDAESGVGVDVQVGDVNGDTLPDIVVANKAGVYILTQQRKDTTADLTPKKLYGPALKPQAEYAKGQSPSDALKSMQLPTGFKAELIAAEPDLVQPIAFTFDERGRIWVVEGNSYPQPREVGKGQDRIKVLEDQDGDGTFETTKIFCEGLNLASGIELGFGGVWVGAAPYLMFIPRDGDRPAAGDGRSKMADGSKEQTPSTISQPPSPAGLPKTIASMPRVPGLPFVAYALLDGWGSQDTHETLNSFIWGPDGWLYGCHGVFTHSRVGKPGTPDDQRLPINAGVWRYHPVRHTFEIFAEGTSNPWGLDYDQHGEFFVTACVIPHLYHIVPGGRYQRQAGQHFNPYTYDDIKTIADHLHYAGSQRPDVSHDKTTGAGIVNDDTNALGGGHAHCGLAIYQSNQFPATYRNQLIFGNLHGHRLVTNYIDPKGSTYVGKHGSDFMRANDMNFIPVTQKVGPDGALYVSDWSDKQICHRGSAQVELWDRSNGRIYKVSYVGERSASVVVAGVLDPGGAAVGQHPAAPSKTGPTSSGGEAKPSRTGVTDPSYNFPKLPFDLAKESDETLAKLAVQTENEWFSRMARRVFMERAANKSLTRAEAPAASPIEKLLFQEMGQGNLKASWVMGSLAGVGPGGDYRDELRSSNPDIQSYNIRTIADLLRHDLDQSQDKPAKLNGHYDGWYPRPLLQLAEKSLNAKVRRELASMLSKLPNGFALKKDLATALLAHGEDKDDPYIPLLIWYGIEPLVGADAKVGLELAKASKMPKVTEFIYRRLGAEDAGRTGLLTLAAETKDAAQRDALLNTVILAARAGNKITMPVGWVAMKEKLLGVPPSGGQDGDTLKREHQTTELEAFMGVPEAKQAFRTQLTNSALTRDQRDAALALLLSVRDAETAPLLIQLIKADDKALTRRAVQALATLAHPETPALLTAKFTKFDAATQQDVINTLATNAAGAKALLAAVKAKTIATSALSPFLARQIASLKNAEVDGLLKETFGDLNAPKPDLEERKKKFRTLLAQAVLAKADKAKGKILFSAVCGSCHQMFGEGQKVGPDLTGSNRANLDYLLDNVLDPNAVIGKDYQLNLFELNDGRVASGVVKEATPAAYRITMPGGLEQTISVSEVKARTIAKVSTMPEGLFDSLPPDALQQLVAYLQSNSVASSDTLKREHRTVAGALEGEALKVLEITGGRATKQGMGGFGSEWSGGAQLWWTQGKPDQKLTLAIPVKEAGRYTLYGALTMARDYGVVSITLNGKPVASSFDGYNGPKVIHSGERDWGTHDLTTGEHQLTFTLAPPNLDAVPSNMVGIDYVRLEKK